MNRNVAKGDRLSPISGVWEGDVALSLMRAAPFQISDLSRLHFNPAIQAAEVLCSTHNRIPKTDADWTERLSSKDARERQKALRRLTWNGAEYKLIYQWRTYQGDQIWIEEQGRRKSGLGDLPTSIEGIIRNVTKRKRAEDRATYLANHDDLTGVANLSSLQRSLDHLSALSRRQRSEGALLRLRITNIKDINDVYGFETGDKVLIEFAKRLSRIVRMPDVVGRIGEDDFALVLYGATQADVKAITDRLFFLLENSPVKTPHGGLYGEISIGSTQIRTQAHSAEEALSQSLVAVKQAKPSKLCMFKDSMAVEVAMGPRDTTSQDILDALRRGVTRPHCYLDGHTVFKHA